MKGKKVKIVILVLLIMISIGVVLKIYNQPSIERELNRLQSRNPKIRTAAAKALSEIRDNRAIEPLIIALKYKDANVRMAAAMALGVHKAKEAVGPLINLLQDRSSNVRYWAAKALGDINDPHAIPPLIIALKDTNRDVRSNVLYALSKFRDPRVEDPIMYALNDKEDSVRSAAKSAVRRLYDEHEITAKILRVDYNPEHVKLVDAAPGFEERGGPHYTLSVDIEILKVGPITIERALLCEYKIGDVLTAHMMRPTRKRLLQTGDIIIVNIHKERKVDGLHFELTEVRLVGDVISP